MHESLLAKSLSWAGREGIIIIIIIGQKKLAMEWLMLMEAGGMGIWFLSYDINAKQFLSFSFLHAFAKNYDSVGRTLTYV